MNEFDYSLLKKLSYREFEILLQQVYADGRNMPNVRYEEYSKELWRIFANVLLCFGRE
jgi:hypothetical protein